MPSFDIVSEIDLSEVDNALAGVEREIKQRFDFKGSKATIERTENEIIVLADDDTKNKAIIDMIKTYFTRTQTFIRRIQKDCVIG